MDITKDNKKCLIYCRVSSSKQAQQGESIEVQEKICRGIAEKNNLKVIEVFKEQFSGRKDNRPVIEDIFSFIKKSPQKIDYLIFRAIDRFSRNGTLGYENLKKQLADYNVQLIDSNGIIQPTKNTLEHLGLAYDWSITRPSEITELVMAQQGKNEVNQILTRMIGQEVNLVREGYKVRQENDGFINNKIFVDGKKKVIQIPDPNRAEFFIKMFEMSATHTDQEIVDYINAMGYRSKIFKQWSKSKDKVIGARGGIKLTVKQLQKIRQRTIYCGINTEKWVEKPTRTKYKGLVSIDCFNNANKGKIFIEDKMDGSIEIHKDYNIHQLKRMKNNPLFPHKAVILCPICHKPLLGSVSKGKSGKGFPAYHCARNHSRYAVNKKDFEKQLTEFVSNLKYKDEGFIKSLEATVMNKYREKEKELGEFSLKVGATVAELETEKIQKIKSYTSTENAIIKNELEKQINDIHQQIQKTREQRNGLEVQENDIHSFVRYVKELMEHPVEMLVKQEDINALKGLFSVVFDELPTYEEIVNGTPKLSLAYQLSEEFHNKKSLNVTLRGIGPRLQP
jgi:hypothetical protein